MSVCAMAYGSERILRDVGLGGIRGTVELGLKMGQVLGKFHGFFEFLFKT